jgi:hypothetical protein
MADRLKKIANGIKCLTFIAPSTEEGRCRMLQQEWIDLENAYHVLPDDQKEELLPVYEEAKKNIHIFAQAFGVSTTWKKKSLRLIE